MIRHTLLVASAAILIAQNPAPPASKPAVTPKPAAAPVPDAVLATVAGKPVHQSDFELFLSLLLNPQQRMQMEMVQGAKDQYRKQFLDFKVMEAKARKDGLDKTEAFRQKREMVEAQILIQEMMKREAADLQKKAEVSEADVKAYYDAHQDQFKTKETFNARHILVMVNPGDPTKTEELAQAKLTKIQDELKAGKKLEELTKEFSDDPGSKEKGGLYENTTFGSFVPEFENAVRTQEIGKVGKPVKSQYGYHLIQVEKITPGEAQTFEKAKDQAQQKAAAAKQEEVFQAYVDGLKKDVGYANGGTAVAPARPGKAKASGKTGGKK